MLLPSSFVFSGLFYQSDAKQHVIECKHVMILKRKISLLYFVICNTLNEIKLRVHRISVSRCQVGWMRQHTLTSLAVEENEIHN